VRKFDKIAYDQNNYCCLQKGKESKGNPTSILYSSSSSSSSGPCGELACTPVSNVATLNSLYFLSNEYKRFLQK
jgi:hypothetical protein